MSPTLVAILVVIASLGAWFLFIGYTAFASKTKKHEFGVPLPEAAPEGAEPVPGAPGYLRQRPTRRAAEDVNGVSRRQFLNRAWATAMFSGLTAFGLVSLDFLFPRLRGGFGAKIEVTTSAGSSNVNDIRSQLAASRNPEFIADGRFWLTLYEGNLEDAAKIPAYKAANVDQTGFMALYRKCVHLGCSVPWCPPAKWFECPCHGSKYSINGEYRDGPAPRSLDQFRVEIKGGKLIVDTSTIIQGAPRNVITSQPQPEGIHCVDIGGE